MDPKTKRMVEQHIGLVHSIAKRHATYFAEYDDLVQEGCLELIRVVENWDGERKFTAYAGACVRGRMQHYMRDKGYSMRQKRGEERQLLSLNAPRLLEGDEVGETMDTLAALEEEPEVSYDHVLEKLTMAQRYIFNKVVIERQPAYQIAKQKRVATSVIHRQLRAIKEKFRIYL